MQIYSLFPNSYHHPPSFLLKKLQIHQIDKSNQAISLIAKRKRVGIFVSLSGSL